MSYIVILMSFQTIYSINHGHSGSVIIRVLPHCLRAGLICFITDIHEVHHFVFVYSNGAKITGHFVLIQRQSKLFPLSVTL